MKILHIISGDLWAGAEVQAFTLLTTLQKQPGVDVAAALMNEGKLAERLRECNIPVTVLQENTLSVFAIIAGLCKLMRDWRPDVIHTHRFKENIFGSLASVLVGGIPSVRTAHGAAEHPARGLRKLPKRLLARLDRWLGTNVQKCVIAVSADLATKLACEFPAEKIRVIENGINIDDVRSRIKPIDFRLHDPDSTHIGIVGRLTAVKRVDLFLEACAHLSAELPDKKWHFHIFGDGPLLEQLTQKAHALRITTTMTFHGHRDDIPACIANLDTLVMCSDHEGLPMTILEAIAIGTKIVAHAVGGIPAVLENYSQGRLVQQHDSVGYARAIASVLQHPLSDTSIELLERISAERNANEILECYRQLVANQQLGDSERKKGQRG